MKAKNDLMILVKEIKELMSINYDLLSDNGTELIYKKLEEIKFEVE